MPHSLPVVLQMPGWKILSDQRFTRFLAASGLTNLADGVATVAWAWVASLLTRDPVLIACLPVALRLPWFLFAVPAGIITDRVDRRHLILTMDGARAFVFAAAALAVWLSLPLSPPPESGLTSPGLFWALLVAAFLIGGAEVFRDNSAQTMLPAIVPAHGLERANGRLWSVELIGNALIGPALGAALIATSAPLPFALNAVGLAIAFLVVLGLTGTFRAARSAPRHWKTELAEGWNFLRDAPLLRTLAWVTGGWNLLFQMAMIALVLHVQENLGLGATGYGLILAAGAIGGVAGGSVGGPAVRRLGPARVAQWSLAASAPAFLLMALAPGPLILAVVFAVFEFAGILWNTVSVSYRQRTIPDALLGRVNSLYRLLAWGMMPLGLLLSGLVVRVADGIMPRPLALQTPFLLAALAGGLLVALAWRRIGRGFADK